MIGQQFDTERKTGLNVRIKNILILTSGTITIIISSKWLRMRKKKTEKG
jgi:hypothetical protein